MIVRARLATNLSQNGLCKVRVGRMGELLLGAGVSYLGGTVDSLSGRGATEGSVT